MEYPDNHVDHTNNISIFLLWIAFLSRFAQLIIENYDLLFKPLSIISLMLVCAVNAGKLVEQLFHAYDKVKATIKKRIKK